MICCGVFDACPLPAEPVGDFLGEPSELMSSGICQDLDLAGSFKEV